MRARKTCVIEYICLHRRNIYAELIPDDCHLYLARPIVISRAAAATARYLRGDAMRTPPAFITRESRLIFVICRAVNTDAIRSAMNYYFAA